MSEVSRRGFIGSAAAAASVQHVRRREQARKRVRVKPFEVDVDRKGMLANSHGLARRVVKQVCSLSGLTSLETGCKPVLQPMATRLRRRKAPLLFMGAPIVRGTTRRPGPS